MTEYLCNSLGYSKQAYYKSLRADRGGEERERHVLSIVQDIRRDMPNLGVHKLWNMLRSNGLPGRSGLALPFTSPSRFNGKTEEVPGHHDRFPGLASPGSPTW